MFFFSPLINQFIEKASRKTAKLFFLTGVILFCFISVFLGKDLFDTDWGYSFLWLSFLYALGAYLKKYKPWDAVKKRSLFLGYIIGSLVLLSFKLIERFLYSIPNPIANIMAPFFPTFFQYISPIVLFNAICLVLLFSKLEIRKNFFKKLISILSTVSFGVFLIHIKSPIREPLMQWFAFADTAPLYITIPLCFGIVIVQYLFCGAIDLIRKLLFDVCKVRNLCVWIEPKIKALILKILKIFKIDYSEVSAEPNPSATLPQIDTPLEATSDATSVE